MGFTRKQIVREVTVTLSYPHLYFAGNGEPERDKNGNPLPQKFRFHVGVLRKLDRDIMEAEKALGNGRQFQPSEQLAKLVTREPEGFDDFPIDERPLEERVREYFSGEMEGFAEAALIARSNVIFPEQLFRESQNSELGSNSTQQKA